MGYSARELTELQATIDGSTADVVIAGTPTDLSRLMCLNKPVVRARYEFAETGEPRLSALVEGFLERKELLRRDPH